MIRSLTENYPFKSTFHPRSSISTLRLTRIITAIKLYFSFLFIAILAIPIAPPAVTANDETFPISVEVHEQRGDIKNIKLYSGYHALVIGCSFYGRRWPALSGSARFADEVTDTFEHLGFSVQTVKNPDGQQLRDALYEFSRKKGDGNRAVVIYFAGHGYTINGPDGVKSSYIVPVDAPDPDIDPGDFINKAVSFAELEQMSRLIQAKHVLFLFDACFNADILALSRPEPSPYLNEDINAPLRAFIINGDEGEQKPEQNFFKTVLISGLKEGYADRSPKDGYITDRELGQYLQEQVASYSYGSQFPLYGRIREPSLDKGEFIFIAPNSSASPAMPDSTPGGTEMETGSLDLSTNPDEALTHLEGKYMGVTPLKIEDIPAGRRVIRVSLEGYEEEVREVLVRAGREAALRFNLTKKKPKGHLTISPLPFNAAVAIVNIREQYTPGIQLPEGIYTVRISKNGYESELREIHLSGGQDLNVEITLKRRINPDRENSDFAPLNQTTWTEPITGMEFILISGGCFQMGCRSITYDCEKDELPVHDVCLNDYWLGKYEVTQKQWQRIMGENKSYFKENEQYPVENISWDEARRFIAQFNERAGKAFRLPTEAEWEYAARSADKQAHYAAANSVD
ncbi:MAG: SUMF1/EgtB/PvdO family nonheme iron enzyme, partial [Desulfobulbaceae bacterium]|nr:SUMF1/EgtB/PvdO family nonheme iron enzyme [Desulfobulbaceae bacterium]